MLSYLQHNLNTLVGTTTHLVFSTISGQQQLLQKAINQVLKLQQNMRMLRIFMWKNT